ncbi:MAG: transposase [Chloroflexi bacterium]|nr:transposase [Chloroflexota bacterium]
MQTLFLEAGSPWENRYIRSFNGEVRNELVSGELLKSLREARILIQVWRRGHNHVRPHRFLGYRPSALKAVMRRPSAAALYFWKSCNIWGQVIYTSETLVYDMSSCDVLVAAVPSGGRVQAKLAAADGGSVVLGPGEYLEVTLDTPPQTIDSKRSFVLETTGECHDASRPA